MAAYEVGQDTVEGFPVTVLSAEGAGLRAAFAHTGGMVACSLRHRGEEVLGQRGGLRKYVEKGSSMGIPILHPWANRLDGMRYSVGGREVELDGERTPIHLEEHGLPIHGLAAGTPHWELTGASADDSRARLLARLDWAAHEELMAGFPFAHELSLEVTLSGATLVWETVLTATGGEAVPVSFGWHPYFTLPGVARADYEVTLAVRRRALLDENGIPTGEAVPFEEGATGPLGERTYDDLFVELTHPPEFAARGGGRCIEARWEAGYPYAVVFAPPGEDYVCFEPMTAPTNALVTGDGLRTVAPGERYAARFAVTVTDDR
ncbi:MAG TPA: aldose 1-epimerase [Solirubrobacteraceae bacterium]|nr:aldose 1-epimerase [Solirubrobacteraceae bacterium]